MCNRAHSHLHPRFQDSNLRGTEDAGVSSFCLFVHWCYCLNLGCHLWRVQGDGAAYKAFPNALVKHLRQVRTHTHRPENIFWSWYLASFPGLQLQTHWRRVRLGIWRILVFTPEHGNCNAGSDRAHSNHVQCSSTKGIIAFARTVYPRRLA